MACHYFYDLPVYRLSSDAYCAVRAKHIDKVVFRLGTPDEAALQHRERLNPRVNDGFRDHLQHTYGGCWVFNEIIGYIRLHFLGAQVRGEYFAVAKKRIVRTRTKTFEYRTWKLAPEVAIEEPYGTHEVLTAIHQYIADCRRELPKRVIETSRFDALSPFVDWGSLWTSSAVVRSANPQASG
jgi:hypothetical protein